MTLYGPFVVGDRSPATSPAIALASLTRHSPFGPPLPFARPSWLLLLALRNNLIRIVKGFRKKLHISH